MAYQDYVFTIVKEFHEKDKLVRDLFHGEFTKDPEVFKWKLLAIPDEEFFDRLLNLMSEIFLLQFVWHRYNFKKHKF